MRDRGREIDIEGEREKKRKRVKERETLLCTHQQRLEEVIGFPGASVISKYQFP